MDAGRRAALLGGLSAAAWLGAGPLRAAERGGAEGILDLWYRLALELVRHTPTYSPPVASRAFAYLGVTAFETLAGGESGLRTLAGQLNGLEALPSRPAGQVDEAVALTAALAGVVSGLFANTGPTGQRAIRAVEGKLSDQAMSGLAANIAAPSLAYGRAVAVHVLAWAASDGGAAIRNMGFPFSYVPRDAPGAWVPTSLIVQQQAPLLPAWGNNRPFALPDGGACPLPPPPAYSEEPGSAFHDQAREVYDTSRTLTAEQRMIARFWADDPMLSPTPPGHWISIAIQVLDAEGADVARRAEVLARLGVALADAFIACWHVKYEYDLLRPVTYIRRLIDPAWEPLLTTPPFPEYPSGHSTQSGAAAGVLAALFGESFPFEDRTHEDDGLPPRSYPSFAAAAEEAAISRFYGGIHFPAAIERGLEQGECVARHVNALRTRT